MTPEQSAAVAALDAAIDCFDFENPLGAVPITHDAADDLRDACTPENIRALLDALDEAQQDAARLESLLADFSPMGLDANGNHAWAYRRNFSLRGPNMRAAIDAARASAGGAA